MRLFHFGAAVIALCVSSIQPTYAHVIEINYAGTYSGSSTFCDFITGCETNTTTRSALAVRIVFDTSAGTLTVGPTSSSFSTLTNPYAATVSFDTFGSFDSFNGGFASASAGTASQYVQGLTLSKVGSNTPAISINVNNPAIPASLLQPFAITSGLDGRGEYTAPTYVGNIGYSYGYYDLELDSMIVTVDGLAPGIPQAVPEPSTWAMLLLGFCGLGVLLHRQRSKPRLG